MLKKMKGKLDDAVETAIEMAIEPITMSLFAHQIAGG